MAAVRSGVKVCGSKVGFLLRPDLVPSSAVS